MKKVICIILGICFFSFGMTKAQTLSIDDVIKNYIKSSGLDKASLVKTLIFSGKANEQGQEFPYIMFMMPPSKIKLEVDIQGQKMIQAYNGKIGWMVAPWTGSTDPQDFPESALKDFKENADLQGQIYNWKEKGHKAELVGKEAMEGTQAYKIKLTKKDGDIEYYYIDADAFVLLKTTAKRKIQNNEIESETLYSNYKDVNGVMVAHNIEQRFKGQTASQVTVDKIEVNKDIDEAIFERPVKK